MRLMRTLLLPLTALATLVAAPTAQAATLELDSSTGVGSVGSCAATSSGGSHGYACFQRYGDYFYLGGYDGVRVGVYWRHRDGSRHGIIRWTPTDRYTLGFKNKDLDEDKVVEFRFGICAAGSGCDAVGDLIFVGNWASSPIGQ